LREQLENESVGLFGDRVHVLTLDPDRVTREAKQALTLAGLTMSDLRSIEPSLEDVFVSVLAKGEGGETSYFPVQKWHLGPARNHG